MPKNGQRKKIIDNVKETLGIVPQWVDDIPDAALPGFWAQMRDFQLAETRIPNKYKDLIGLAVAGATRCRYCALFHTEGAKLHGATDEEIAEASMLGGFSMQASTFLNAQQVDYDVFKKETKQIVSYVKRQMTGKAKPSGRSEARA